MDVTVAICTWNRADLLDRTLYSMHSLHIPEGITWELLVVNNNCTDRTDEVLAFHAETLPLRRLFEPTPGHSHARNCAISATRGKLLIWTDDDVWVDPNWLREYVRAAQSWPEAGYFGGFIEPEFEGSPPKWILENLHLLQSLLVIRDLGEVEEPFTGGKQPFGANMAMRASIFQQKMFDPNLGRKENQCILADEIDFFRALREQGVLGIWTPRARLKHFVPRKRMTRDYLWEYFSGTGQTEVRLKGTQPSNSSWIWRGAPRWRYRKRWEATFRAYRQLLQGKPEWVPTFIKAAILDGEIRELRRRCIGLARK